MALSVGFRIPVSQLQSCYPSYGAPTLTPVGLSPTERASLRWTHEVGDRLEVRHQLAREPDQLHVALRLPLQSAAGLNAVQVSVDVDLQQRGWVISRPARLSWLSPSKPQLTQIQLFDEGVNHPDRIVVRDPFIEAFRKQDTLCSLLTLDESAHQTSPSSRFAIVHLTEDFSHSLDHGGKRHSPFRIVGS